MGNQASAAAGLQGLTAQPQKQRQASADTAAKNAASPPAGKRTGERGCFSVCLSAAGRESHCFRLSGCPLRCGLCTHCPAPRNSIRLFRFPARRAEYTFSPGIPRRAERAHLQCRADDWAFDCLLFSAARHRHPPAAQRPPHSPPCRQTFLPLPVFCRERFVFYQLTFPFYQKLCGIASACCRQHLLLRFPCRSAGNRRKKNPRPPEACRCAETIRPVYFPCVRSHCSHGMRASPRTIHAFCARRASGASESESE